MRIILVRHAKVLADTDTPVLAAQLQTWLKHYDTAPVDNALPSQELFRLAQASRFVFTSTLSRAQHSARLLGIKHFTTDAHFNEADIPNITLPFLSLPPKTWLAILRWLMVLRLGKADATFRLSKQRAHRAATLLEEKAKTYENVMLIGHGGMNWLIGKELKKRGWHPVIRTGHGNWDYSVFASHP